VLLSQWEVCIVMNETVPQARNNGKVLGKKLDFQSETKRTLPHLGMLEIWTPICNVFCS
jgi:hypothetical protein